MMFSSLLKPENIILERESTEKDVLFAEMVENIVTTHPSVNRSEALAALTERENKMNTCIKSGIAVPHASCTSVTYPVVSIGISRGGIDYEVEGGAAPDSEESRVHLVIMILFEQGNTERHLHILAECAHILQTPAFYQTALTAGSASEIIEKLRRIEEV